MRTRTRLAMTAGVTAVGFTAMSGMAQAAQADTGGLGDLTGSLGKTVDGLLNKPAARTDSNSGDIVRLDGSGLHVKLPVKVHVPLGTPAKDGRGPALNVKAPAKVAVGKGHVKLSLGLCVGVPRGCGSRPNPTPQPPPTPPTPPTPPGPTPPPASPPPVVAEPASAGSLAIAKDALPYTGGPIGAMALVGATAVLAGAAGVAGSRLRLRARP